MVKKISSFKINSSTKNLMYCTLFFALLLISIAPTNPISVTKANESAISSTGKIMNNINQLPALMGSQKNKINLVNSNLTASFTPLNSQLQQQAVGNGYPKSWTSTTTYSDNGFLTVGGDGLLFYQKNTFTAPSYAKKGYYTGSAWNGNEFLVVGQYYSPGAGAMMALYYPNNNTYIDISNLFPGYLSTNTTLYQTIWNGTDFIILGSYQINSNPQTLFLYSYNPTTNILTSISPLTPTFDFWNTITLADMYFSPVGIFFLIHANSGTKFGLLATNNTYLDLSQLLPTNSFLSNNHNDLAIVQNLMFWQNKSLFIVNNYDNNTFSVLNYNPLSNTLISYYNDFNGLTGFVSSLSYLQGYFIISGYNITDYSPFMYAFQTNGTLINLLQTIGSTLNASNNSIISSASDHNQTLYITYGHYPNVYYGYLTIQGPPEPLYKIQYNAYGLNNGESWSLSVAGQTITSTSAKEVVSEPAGSYFYSIPSNPGLTASPNFGWITITNSNYIVNISFVVNESRLSQFRVVFNENGLPQNTNWSITLNGATKSQEITPIIFMEIAGGYQYTVGVVAGYTASPTSGNINVANQEVLINITFMNSNSIATNSARDTITTSTPGLEAISMLSILVLGIIKRFRKKK